MKNIRELEAVNDKSKKKDTLNCKRKEEDRLVMQQSKFKNE